jgi:hypothetical protein
MVDGVAKLAKPELPIDKALKRSCLARKQAKVEPGLA